MKKQALTNLMLVIILLSLTTFMGCKKEEVNMDASSFEGIWINEKTLSDTLVVTAVSTFTLNRGKRMTAEGNLISDYGSGTYSYTINDNKILLNWILSSDSNSKEYSFNLNDGRLSIGNFYEPAPQSEPVVTFKKIR